MILLLLNRIQKTLIHRFGDILIQWVPEEYKSKRIADLLAFEFFPEKAIQTNGFIDQLILDHFRKTYDPEMPSEYYRNIIRNQVWGGTTGKSWHLVEAGDDPELDKYGRWRTLQIEQILKLLEICPEIKNIVEIGCGNGLYLNQIREKAGTKYDYFGIDLSEEQIQWNIKHYHNLQNMKFFAGAAGEVMPVNQLEGVLYLTFGTLSCFTESELRQWLRQVYAQPGFQALSIAEWNINYSPEIEKVSQPMSPTLYNHSYRYLSEEMGFVINEIMYADATDITPGYIRTLLTAVKK